MPNGASAIMSGHIGARAQASPTRNCTPLRQFLWRAGLGLLALSIAGCGTTLRPLIISNDLVQGNFVPTGEPKTCDAPKADSAIYGDLPKSICRVNALRVRYLEGVVDDAQLKNLLGMGLIAASAYGIYKGITSSGDGTQRMLARLGIGAGAAYAYGENFISEPRQRTYLAGSDALGCAVLASSAYLYTNAEFGVAGTPSDATLQGAQAATIDATAALEQKVASTAKAWSTKAASMAACSQAPTPAPPAAGTSAQDAEAINSRHAQAAKQQHLACPNVTSKVWSDAAVAAKSRVTDALGEATRGVAAAHDSINTATVLIGRINSASAQLEARASEIQTQVAIEVMKSQPNLAAIFEGGANLRLNAEKFSGSPLFKAGAGTGVVKAESRVAMTTKRTDSANQALINQAESDITELQRLQLELFLSKAHLDGWTARAQERAKQLGSLKACKFDGAAAGALELTPDVTDIQLAEKGSFTWFVHGVTGRPQTYGVGANIDSVQASVVGQSVTLTLIKALPDGQSALWMITDSNAGAHREVRISNPGSGPAPPSAAAAGSTDALSAGQLVEICQKFGDPNATDPACMGTAQMKAKVSECAESLKKLKKPASTIEAQKAMLNGQCTVTR